MRKNTADTKRRASTCSSLRLKEVLELAATAQRDRRGEHLPGVTVSESTSVKKPRNLFRTAYENSSFHRKEVRSHCVISH